MNTTLTLSAYGAAFAVVVAGTYTLGTALGPQREVPPVPTTGCSAHTAHSAPAGSRAAGPPPGLASSRGGYTLVADNATLGSGMLALRITGPDGAPVTAFDKSHEEPLHLIVVRRDTTCFQHLHPVMDAAGTWRVPLTVDAGGVYRAFADFAPTGGDGATAAGPGIGFHAEVPSAGTYRLFLDFQVDGVIRTAEFTVATAGSPA